MSTKVRTIATLTIAIGLFVTNCASAQDTGTLRLVVDPEQDFTFVVDGKHRMQQREVTLLEGLHRLSVWAPGRTIVDTNVFVIAARTSDLHVRLPYSDAFIDYRKELAKFDRKRTLIRSIPGAMAVGGIVWGAVALNNYEKAHERLEQDKADYESGVEPNAIATLKDVTIPDHRKQFRAARTSFYAATGFTLASAGLTWYIIKRTAKWDPPAFNDPEKVKFDGLSWVPGPNGGFFATSITIPLAR